jgi:hypothetical protein
MNTSITAINANQSIPAPPMPILRDADAQECGRRSNLKPGDIYFTAFDLVFEVTAANASALPSKVLFEDVNGDSGEPYVMVTLETVEDDADDDLFAPRRYNNWWMAND